MANSISAVRFTAPFGYYDGAGEAHNWAVGQRVYDAATIADLKARNAPVVAVDESAPITSGEWAQAHLPAVNGLADALDSAAKGLRGFDGRTGTSAFYGPMPIVNDDASLLAAIDVVEPKLTSTISDALKAIRADLATRKAA